MSSEDAASSSTADHQLTFNVKASNDAKYVLTLPATTTVADLKAKLSTSEYADTPVERLRLIYSGRVLKDPDTLGSYKIKDGHTIHLVKGAASNARQNPASQGSTSTAGATPTSPTVPSNMAAGTGNNPLAALTGARYAGFHGLPNATAFGADGGVRPIYNLDLAQDILFPNNPSQMGAPPNPDDMMRMLDDPNFLQQMNEMMNNPAFQQMIEQSPMLRDNPMARQMLRDPNFRRIMFDPNMLRMQLQMQRSLGGGAAGLGGAAAFPPPGVTDTTPSTGEPGTQGGNATAAAANPFGSLFGAAPPAGAQANPFAALFGGMPPQTTGTTSTTGTTGTTDTTGTTGTTGTSSAPPAEGAQPTTANPLSQLLETLAALNQAAPAAGGRGSDSGSGGDGSGAAVNPFAALFNPWGGAPPQPAAPPDTRPPEERYADQLRQLNDMGFYEFERNVQALRRSGGSVQGAVEFLLGGGGQ